MRWSSTMVGLGLLACAWVEPTQAVDVPNVACINPRFSYGCSYASPVRHEHRDDQSKPVDITKDPHYSHQGQTHTFGVQCEDPCGGSYWLKMDLNAQWTRSTPTGPSSEYDQGDATVITPFRVVRVVSPLHLSSEQFREFQNRDERRIATQCADSHLSSLNKLLLDLSAVLPELPDFSEVVELRSRIAVRGSERFFLDREFFDDLKLAAGVYELSHHQGYDVLDRLEFLKKVLPDVALGVTDHEESRAGSPNSQDPIDSRGCFYDGTRDLKINNLQEPGPNRKQDPFSKQVTRLVMEYRELQVKDKDPSMSITDEFVFSKAHARLFDGLAGPAQAEIRSLICPEKSKPPTFREIKKPPQEDRPIGHKVDQAFGPARGFGAVTHRFGNVDLWLEAQPAVSRPDKVGFSRIVLNIETEDEPATRKALEDLVAIRSSSLNFRQIGDELCAIQNEYEEPVPIFYSSPKSRGLVQISGCKGKQSQIAFRRAP